MNEAVLALLPLLAPAVVIGGVIWRIAVVMWNRLDKKLNEGRDMATERSDLMVATLAEHRSELMTEVHAIRALAAATNGKVAEHDKQITSVTAKQEVLLEMMLGRMPDKGV